MKLHKIATGYLDYSDALKFMFHAEEASIIS
jgi:hypothetical protein